MQLENLQDLLMEDLKDVLHAENQIVKALPKMIKSAANEDLQAAFEEHLIGYRISEREGNLRSQLGEWPPQILVAKVDQ